jgi:transcriptional regulator with XRE-family HTH domain
MPTKLVQILEKEIAEGKSRRQIARESDVSDTTIRNILSGENPDRTTIDKLAEWLKLEPTTVYRMSLLTPEEFDNPDYDPMIDAIARRIGEIEDEEVRKRVIKVLDALLEAEGF